jgi:hypothetical protein
VSKRTPTSSWSTSCLYLAQVLFLVDEGLISHLSDGQTGNSRPTEHSDQELVRQLAVVGASGKQGSMHDHAIGGNAQAPLRPEVELIFAGTIAYVGLHEKVTDEDLPS